MRFGFNNFKKFGNNDVTYLLYALDRNKEETMYHARHNQIHAIDAWVDGKIVTTTYEGIDRAWNQYEKMRDHGEDVDAPRDASQDEREAHNRRVAKELVELKIKYNI